LNYDNLLINARSENRDLQIARKNSDLSVLALKDAQSQRYPMLNFQTAYNYNQLNSQTGFLEYNQSYGPSFGFTISYPIFNGFNVNRTIANAKVELHTQQTQVRDTELSVQTDLYTIFIDYITNLQIVDIEIINQEVARKDMEVAFEKYRLGSISDIDLRETQKKYIDAQYQLLLSEFQAKQAETELLQISGELGKMLE
jgi:outer membrane protein TolC